MDSGATCQIVNKFINFTKLDGAGDVTLGVGHSVEASGIGTVELNVSVSDGK